ncbi:MAG: MFS transporter, partial [Jatrophihabitantaceae bacterium]
ASAPSITILVVGAALLVAFGLVERNAPEPVLPLWVLHRRLLVTSSLASCGVGAIVLGLSSYIPTFVQGVLSTGPLVAGFALATLTVGWPIAGSQAGRVYLRIGFRRCGLIGASIVVAGSALLLLLGERSSVAQVGAACFVIGLGMGLVATPTLVAAQSSVEWRERGVVTGANMFFRSVGSAVGVAAFGAIANATLGDHAHALGSGHVPAGPLSSAVHNVFLAVGALALLTVAAVALMPHDVGQSRQPAPTGTRAGTARAGDVESAGTRAASRITPAP